MKAITKLLFVALLIGVALSLPAKVKASSGQYTCNWQYYGQCYGNLQSWMNGCTQDCTEYSYTAGSGQYCYGLATNPYAWYTDPVTGQTTTVLGPTTYSQVCWPTEYSNFSCLQQCVSEYNSGLEDCVSEWCTSL
jgi:hypothetical protein